MKRMLARSRRSSLLMFGALLFALSGCEHDTQPANAPVSRGPLPPGAVSDVPAPAPNPITREECRAQSGELLFGEPRADAPECPNGRLRLGFVLSGSERGSCCATSTSEGPGADVPPPPVRTGAKRPACALGTDQTCNEDPTVSAIWGHCTELGVCECKAGFALTPAGRCRPK